MVKRRTPQEMSDDFFNNRQGYPLITQLWGIFSRNPHDTRHPFWVGFLSLALLAGCAGQQAPGPDKPLSSPAKPATPSPLLGLPTDAETKSNEALIDLQLALADRGLYLKKSGDIGLVNPGHCPIEKVSHRGDSREPENSLAAIRRALQSGFDTVEIDIMRLRDRNWLLNHDPYTGHAVLHATDRHVKIEHMDSFSIRSLRTRDPFTKQPIKTPPALAVAGFKVFGDSASPSQKLNVEIKSTAAMKELKGIDIMLSQLVGTGRYYYSSSNLDVLKKMRAINPDVYLGFIQQPHKVSVERLKSKTRQALSNDPTYQQKRRRIDWAVKRGTAEYHKKYRDYTSSRRLLEVRAKLAPNTGLHLDIRRYLETPNVKLRAQSLGMKVQTYTINGTDYHQTGLKKLAKINKLPHGAIVDVSSLELCQNLFGIQPPAGQYTPRTSKGKIVAALPQDAHFGRIDEQWQQYADGMYIDRAGQLQFFASRAVKRSTPLPAIRPAIPVIHTPKDEEMAFGDVAPVELNFPVD